MGQQEAIRLYDRPAPGSESWNQHERAYHDEIFETDVVTNVVVPTLTPVLPERCCGTALIVAPGGGYHALSINSEGFEVATWLAERGVAAFVLKYRLVPSGEDAVAELFAKMESGRANADMEGVAPLAAADARTAVRLVRDGAGQFGVDAARIGLMGFSAGGNVAMRVAYAPDPGERPDFLAPIYASVRGYELADPPAGSGPIFVAAATDDQLGLTADSLAIYERWRAAGLPAELHLYASGGHGFGMRTQGLPSDTWIERFGDWLTANDLMESESAVPR